MAGWGGASGRQDVVKFNSNSMPSSPFSTNINSSSHAQTRTEWFSLCVCSVHGWPLCEDLTMHCCSPAAATADHSTCYPSSSCFPSSWRRMWKQFPGEAAGGEKCKARIRNIESSTQELMHNQIYAHAEWHGPRNSGQLSWCCMVNSVSERRRSFLFWGTCSGGYLGGSFWKEIIGIGDG